MVDLYVELIIKGRKSIEDVPLSIVDEVILRLIGTEFVSNEFIAKRIVFGNLNYYDVKDAAPDIMENINSEIAKLIGYIGSAIYEAFISKYPELQEMIDELLEGVNE